MAPVITLCKDCKFYSTRNGKPRGFDGTCDYLTRRPYQTSKDRLAEAQDADDYLAYVKVKEDFGCLAGKPRGGIV